MVKHSNQYSPEFITVTDLSIFSLFTVSQKQLCFCQSKIKIWLFDVIVLFRYKRTEDII
jgi:hypothetical protein